VDQVHPLFSQARSTYTGCTRGLPARGVFPCFSRGCAIAGGELAGEPPWWHWCTIDMGGSFDEPWHLHWWVNTACGALWCAGHGGSLLDTMAAPVIWLRPR
jgi:hypothetical protein